MNAPRSVFLLVALVSINCESLAAPSAEAFGELPSIYDAAISPDGAQIAIIVNIGGNYGVRVLTIGAENEKLRVIGFGEGVKPQWIKWANNGRVLVSTWQSQSLRGTPYTASYIHTVDTSSMDASVLVRNDEIFRQDNSEVVDFLEHDPDHILMAFSDVNQSIKDIQRVDVKNGRYIRVKRGQRGVEYWVTDHRGEPRVGQGRFESGADEQWNLIVRDSDSDKWRSAEEYPGLEVRAPIFGFTSNPNELVIGDRADKDTLGLYVYDLTEKKIARRLFHNDTYDVRGLVTSSDGEVIGATFVADSTETELLGQYQTVLGRVRSQFDGYTVDYIDHSDGGRLALVKISNAYDPGALALVDAKTDEVQMLAAYRSDLSAQEMGAVIPVTYPARDDFAIPAYLTLPPSVTDPADINDLPFVILPHGGPYARTAKRFDYFAQFFATRGFAVLQMNFRGSAGYGKAFEDAGRENWVQMQDDVEDGARWLVSEGYADPDRMCIVGWSYGGYAALMGAIKNPDLYACAISMAGVTDLKDMVVDLKKYRFGAASAQNFLLQGFDSKQALVENSPVKRASELTVPLFLAHGEKDQRVHFDQFRRMKSALKKSSADVTYMSFDDEDHFLSNQENRQDFFKGIDKFLLATVGASELAR